MAEAQGAALAAAEGFLELAGSVESVAGVARQQFAVVDEH